MRRLRVTVIDVVSMGSNRRGIAKLMSANLASLMPQAVAAGPPFLQNAGQAPLTRGAPCAVRLA